MLKLQNKTFLYLYVLLYSFNKLLQNLLLFVFAYNVQFTKNFLYLVRLQFLFYQNLWEMVSYYLIMVSLTMTLDAFVINLVMVRHCFIMVSFITTLQPSKCLPTLGQCLPTICQCGLTLNEKFVKGCWSQQGLPKHYSWLYNVGLFWY